MTKDGGGGEAHGVKTEEAEGAVIDTVSNETVQYIYLDNNEIQVLAFIQQGTVLRAQYR